MNNSESEMNVNQEVPVMTNAGNSLEEAVPSYANSAPTMIPEMTNSQPVMSPPLPSSGSDPIVVTPPTLEVGEQPVMVTPPVVQGEPMVVEPTVISPANTTGAVSSVENSVESPVMAAPPIVNPLDVSSASPVESPVMAAPPVVNPLEVSSTSPAESPVMAAPPVVNPLEVSSTSPAESPVMAAPPIVNPLEVSSASPTVAAPVVNPSAGSTDIAPRVTSDGLPNMGEEETPSQADTNEVLVTDKMEKVQVEYKPASKLKLFGAILLFLLLIGFVVFLPDVNVFVDRYIHGNKEVVAEKITTGNLVCSVEDVTATMSKEYKYTFGFSNNKLEKLTYVVVSRIDPSSDSKSMNILISDCMLLKQSVEGLQGISVRCEDKTSVFTETDIFTLEKVDTEKLTSAFYEAGGTYPEYEYNQNMDDIEKNMNAVGYKCNRER